MIEFGEKTLIFKENGYHYVMIEILDYLEDAHINVLYAYNSPNKTLISYLTKCKTISFDITNYKKLLTNNLFRIDYLLIEAPGGIIDIIDSWVPNNIKVIYLIDKSDVVNIKCDKSYVFSSLSGAPEKYRNTSNKLSHYLIKDVEIDIQYSLLDIKVKMIRDKKIRDLGID